MHLLNLLPGGATLHPMEGWDWEAEKEKTMLIMQALSAALDRLLAAFGD